MKKFALVILVSWIAFTMILGVVMNDTEPAAEAEPASWYPEGTFDMYYCEHDHVGWSPDYGWFVRIYNDEATDGFQDENGDYYYIMMDLTQDDVDQILEGTWEPWAVFY